MAPLLFINQCQNLYKHSFPTNWLNEYSGGNDEKILEGYTKIDSFYKEAFIFLSKAVLCGEYTRTEPYSKILLGFMSQIAIEAGADGDDLKMRYYQLNSDLRDALTHYRDLLMQIEYKIQNSDENLFFSAFQTANANITNQYLSDFIEIVIKQASIDHFLIGDNANKITLILMKDVLEQRNKIENQEIKIIYSALLDKCNFLIKKVFHDPIVGSNYTLNFEKHSISEATYNQSLLKEMSLRYDYLYASNFDIDSFKGTIRKYQDNCFYKDSRLFELIILMKHYQKDNCSRMQVNNLLNSFNHLYEKVYKRQKDRMFDKLALDSMKNYLYNCKFSMELTSNKQYSYNNLKEELSQLEELQLNTHIFNYFPYYKALKFLERTISNDFSTNKGVEVIEEKISFFDELLVKLKNNLKWCKRNKFYPFQLLKNDCTVNDSNITIFMASSFNRPINYTKLDEALSEFILKRKFFDNQLDLLKDKIEILRIKELIKTGEKRNFEYLGIFIAIITFLFASIPTFSSAELPVKEAIINMSSLGLILFLFILLLKTFNAFPKKWYWLLLLILIVISAVILLLYSLCNPPPPQS